MKKIYHFEEGEDMEMYGAECPICGKTFVPTPLWRYRVRESRSGRMVCSWGCVCKSYDVYQTEIRRKRHANEMCKERQDITKNIYEIVEERKNILDKI